MGAARRRRRRRCVLLRPPPPKAHFHFNQAPETLQFWARVYVFSKIRAPGPVNGLGLPHFMERNERQAGIVWAATQVLKTSKRGLARQ